MGFLTFRHRQASSMGYLAVRHRQAGHWMEVVFLAILAGNG